jgi:predicted permease
MGRLFEKIINMSSDRKRTFSLIIAFVLTVLVISIWFLIDNFFIKKENNKDIKTEQGINQLTSSFQDIFQSVNNIPNIIDTASTSLKLLSSSTEQQ